MFSIARACFEDRNRTTKKEKQQSWYLLLSQVCITSQGPLPILVMGDVWVPYINLEVYVQRLLSAQAQRFNSNGRLWATKLLERARVLFRLSVNALHKTTDLLQLFLVVLRDYNRSLWPRSTN